MPGRRQAGLLFRQDRVDARMPHNNSRYFIIHLASNADRDNLAVGIQRKKRVVSKYPVACLASGVTSIIACGTLGLAIGCTLIGLYSAFVQVEEKLAGGKLIRQHISAKVREAMMKFLCRELGIPENIPDFSGLVHRLEQDQDFNRSALKALAKFYRKQLNLKVLPPW